MKELIKIVDSEIGQVVSAKELYSVLGYDISNWASWYKTNILNNDFALDGVDYTQLVPSTRTKDFALSVTFAKKLSMMAKTKKGEEVRDYFLECENIAKSTTKNFTAVSTLDILEMTIKGLREQNLQLEEVKSDIVLLKETVSNIQTINASIDHFSIMGYCRNIKKQIGLAEAKNYGIKCKSICNQMGFVIGKIPDPRFGMVNTYPLDVLKEVINK